MVDEVIRFEKQQILSASIRLHRCRTSGAECLQPTACGGIGSTQPDQNGRRAGVLSPRSDSKRSRSSTSAMNRGRPTRAVAEALNMSHSSAARWVGLARQHGFLPPYSDQGAKERKS